MSNFTAELEGGKIVVRDSDNVLGYIIFEKNNINAVIHIGDDEFQTHPENESDKDIILTQSGQTLLKFKFDYLRGNAEIQKEGEDTGYDIKGKWFKAGTRLTDSSDNDLVVVVSKESLTPNVEIKILNEEEGTPLMIMATLYYHLYTSASKLRLQILQ